ncbi:TPA: hypothetical protein NPR04_002452 [Acinetobacter baumannii]|nr:hypothetical protein [Acinetobacter baumannii]HCJ1341086.1 hypothetical protein [Acinetobacter baumannii]
MHNYFNSFALIFALVLAVSIGLKLFGVDVMWKDITAIMLIFSGGFIGLFVHGKFVVRKSKY